VFTARYGLGLQMQFRLISVSEAFVTCWTHNAILIQHIPIWTQLVSRFHYCWYFALFAESVLLKMNTWCWGWTAAHPAACFMYHVTSQSIPNTQRCFSPQKVTEQPEFHFALLPWKGHSGALWDEIVEGTGRGLNRGLCGHLLGDNWGQPQQSLLR
jgi:hypothetical protein